MSYKHQSIQRKSTDMIRWDNIPLNSRFKDSESHHIDMEHVIHIPVKLHRKYKHKQHIPESMKKINWEAFKFLMNQMTS